LKVKTVVLFEQDLKMGVPLYKVPPPVPDNVASGPAAVVFFIGVISGSDDCWTIERFDEDSLAKTIDGKINTTNKTNKYLYLDNTAIK